MKNHMRTGASSVDVFLSDAGFEANQDPLQEVPQPG